MKEYVMGVDHGGTSSKAVLFDLNGVEIASASRKVEMQMPRPGFTERDMEQLWHANCEAIRECIDRAGIAPRQIMGVSLSGHGKGLYLWGKDDRPARPGIVSTDSRAHGIVERWQADGVAHRAFALACQNILASQPAALLRWLMENEPESIERCRYIFGVKDYIRYRMTGEAAAEITDISGSGLVNLRTAQYDSELLRLFGLETLTDKLPPLVASTEFCGVVGQTCSELTGLPTGTPVAAGLFDIDACAIGMNLCDESRLAVIAGTWAINEYIARSPVIDGSVKMNSLYCLPGYYLAEECSPTSSSNYDWVVHALALEAARAEEQDPFAWANAQVAQISPDSSELLFLPYLHGGCDDARTRGAFVGLEAWHTRAHMLRAVCEGVVLGHRLQVERLQKSRTVPAVAIRLAGGVVRAPEWVQMFADVLGLPVETIDAGELGALGAAMTAAVAARRYGNLTEAAHAMVRVGRVYTPNGAWQTAYARKYRRFVEAEAAVTALHKLWGGPDV